MSADHTLRVKARAFIEAGKIARVLPDQRWGGPGTGASCAFCGAAVEPHETDIEIEDPRGAPGEATIQHFHIGCLSAIEQALRDLELERQALPDSPASQLETCVMPDQRQPSA